MALREPSEQEQTLAGLVKRLARRLHPEDPLRLTATGYLQEHGFFNPLRTAGVSGRQENTFRPAHTNGE